MTTPLSTIYATGVRECTFPASGRGPLFPFNFYYIGATMKQLSFHEKKKIRNRLLAVYKETGKVTERDLLRLSALTGVNYSIIAEIHKSTHYLLSLG